MGEETSLDHVSAYHHVLEFWGELNALIQSKLIGPKLNFLKFYFHFYHIV